jgi:hypothetical protein
LLDRFREIVVLDFEFPTLPGERPDYTKPGNPPGPTCLVAWELRSGRRFRIFEGHFPSAPPYATGSDVLTVAYYASADAGCYRVLGWPLPERAVDLFAEFRTLTNGLPVPCGNGLLGALVAFGLDPHGATEKKEMSKAIGADVWYGQYTPEQILNYCEADVEATSRLLYAMAPRIDWPRALLRGRYMVWGASAIEHHGVPIDTETLLPLRDVWTDIQDDLIAEVDRDYGVFDGRSFRTDWFVKWLARSGIPWWPRLESGNLALDADTFGEMAKAYPIVAPLKELRSSLSELRLNDLAVGHDHRNRCLLSAFRARTGRNAPSNSQYVFGPATWIRGLIKPPPGHAFFYADWRAMEFGIAAALSGDPMMQDAYRSSDVYLQFAKQAGAAPPDATKESHEAVRDLFKTVVLGVGYGMEEQSLALRIGRSRSIARELIRAYRETYHVHRRWSDAAVDTAMLHNKLWTALGWTIYIGENPNVRSLRNFPAQANGAECMRIAACLIAERGVPVGAVVHDAFGVCTRLEDLEEHKAIVEGAMREASRIVLNGFELDVEIKTIAWPNRYMDKRGTVMWAKVMGLLERQGHKLRKAG